MLETPPTPLTAGQLVVSTYAPDGDAVRFIPAQGAQLASLGNAGALRVAPDGSVQLRMQGIDAPDVHYAGRAQPLGVRARTWTRPSSIRR